MVNRLHRAAVGTSAVILLSLGLIAPATANHGPNCDAPEQDVIAWLQDHPEEWQDYDDDEDGVACEATHQLTKADIPAGNDEDDGTNDDDSEGDNETAEDDSNDDGAGDDDDADDGDDDITVPTEIDTGR